MSDSIIDNVLFVITSCSGKLVREELNSLIVDFYKPEELLASKTLLVSECKKIGIIDDIAEFRKT